MLNKVPFLILALLFSQISLSENGMPGEVTQFIDKRDGCDHFRGEEPYNEERRQFLEKNIVELCTGTDSELADLKEKHMRNILVIEKLSVYEIDIEQNK